VVSHDSAAELARRLKMLRERRHATQAQLAAALGVSVPSVSSWETKTVPPTERLDGYALLFAADRPLDAGLPTPDDLTPTQLREYQHLRAELVELRDATLSPAAARAEDSLEPELLRFPQGERVVIVCGATRDIAVDRPYTNPDHPDYDDFYTFADPRAVMELYGELQRLNPHNEIRYKKSERGTLTASDYFNHVMFVGGIDWNTGADDLLEHLELPVRQLPRDKIEDVGAFVVGRGDESVTYESTLTADGRLLEDLVYFYRGPNPFNPNRTVTLFNGNYARGVLGAVRALTSPLFRNGNQLHARTQFGQFSEFSILMRAPVLRNEIVIPDWTVADLRLHEWGQ
jgi:transcriptional regulator with XRE-family HTH domain